MQKLDKLIEELETLCTPILNALPDPVLTMEAHNTRLTILGSQCL